ncbi:Uncharacterized protein Adt_27610 [Abeliophyllum distichum]|uniref:Uncharacterized protein n=1 Tax=Abeliophyllum distichum TaxID=126358 RepID=A0ABD1RU78_9LAMI
MLLPYWDVTFAEASFSHKGLTSLLRHITNWDLANLKFGKFHSSSDIERPLQTSLSSTKVPTTNEEQVEWSEQKAEEATEQNSNTPQVKAIVPVKAYIPHIPFPQRLQKSKLDKQFAKFLEVFKKLDIIPFADAIAQMPSYAKKIGLGNAKATTVSIQLVDRSIKHPRGIIEDILVKVDKLIFLADIILDMEEDKDVPIILGHPFLATGRALIDVHKGQLILRLNDEKVVINVFKAIVPRLTLKTIFK